MLRSIDVRRLVFAAGVLGSMGFGSAQAFAAPRPAAPAGVCEQNVCNALCISRGYHYGICYSHSGCVCYRLYQ